MILKNKISQNWFEKASQILRDACTPYGIKASLTHLDNYGAVFTRDAVMAGIAGLLIKDDVVLEGFKNTLVHLRDLQGEQGQIASNFVMNEEGLEKISFGTLSPKIDSCTWYLAGVGLLIREGIIEKNDFQESVERTIALLDGIEYNGKHLMYVPKGGNWADEYIYEGYILYDQLLRAWGLSLLAPIFNTEWSDKSNAILAVLESKYFPINHDHFISSIFPGGIFDTFDLAAHALAGIVFEKENPYVEKSLDWVEEQFLNQQQFPPAFYPIIKEGNPYWDTLKKYHLFNFKNKPHHYHNGGIWWIWLGWLSIALSLSGRKKALTELVNLASRTLDNLPSFNFDEYLSSDELSPNGTAQLCYTATGIIMLALAKDNYDFSVLKASPKAFIKESLVLKEEYFMVSKEIIKDLQKISLTEKNKCVIGICGESGSGKSTTARCLQIELEKLNIHSTILHQDSYYKLPPKENHKKRKSDLNWVGANEVNMDLLQLHIQAFKSGSKILEVPVVDYENNLFDQQNALVDSHSVLIVEGVYSFFLEGFDYHIFMERNYKDTMKKREERSREIYDPFIEKVLEIEHSIIQPLHHKADLIVKKDYSVGRGIGK